MSSTPSAVRARRVLVDGALVPAVVRLAEGRITALEPLDGGDHVGGDVLDVPDTAVVLPGVVDTHVHVNEPGRTEWEGFATATRAAALGGVTTIIDMPLNSLPPTTDAAALELKRAAAASQVQVDVGFWGGAIPGNLADLPGLWEAGVFGFKCFLSPSGVDEFPPLAPEELEAAAKAIAALPSPAGSGKEGGLLIVHAEDSDVLAAAPQRPSRAYADFLLSRPDAAETAAIARVVDVARRTGCRTHVLHLSSARALDLLAAARDEGLPITVETCPHYLCLAAEEVPDASPAFKCCPPIRDRGNRDALWDALRSGIIDVVVSDHSPATAEVKLAGDGDLQQAWGGVAGLQVGFAAVVHEAGQRGVGLAEVSRWMSRGTADLVGLLDRGRIEVGATADLIVLDEAAPFEVDAARLAHRNPISAYDGRRYDARVTRTLLAGRLLDLEADDAAFAPPQPNGRLLRRPTPAPSPATQEHR